MANARKSLRKAIWPSGKSPNPRDLGEALRDVDQAFRGMTTFTTKVVKGVISGTPFTVALDHAPDAMLVGRALLSNSPTTATWTSTVSWTWDGTQLTVTLTLTGGSLYDVTLLIFG